MKKTIRNIFTGWVIKFKFLYLPQYFINCLHIKISVHVWISGVSTMFIVGIKRVAGVWTWLDGHTIPSAVGSSVWADREPSGGFECARITFETHGNTPRGSLADLPCNSSVARYVCWMPWTNQHTPGNGHSDHTLRLSQVYGYVRRFQYPNIEMHITVYHILRKHIWTHKSTHEKKTTNWISYSIEYTWELKQHRKYWR